MAPAAAGCTTILSLSSRTPAAAAAAAAACSTASVAATAPSSVVSIVSLVSVVGTIRNTKKCELPKTAIEVLQRNVQPTLIGKWRSF